MNPRTLLNATAFMVCLTASPTQAQTTVRPYVDEVAADRPDGWWRLGDAPPPGIITAADFGSGKNNGAYLGTVGKAPGIPGAPDGAGDFQGGYIDVENPLQFDSGGTALTVEAWVQPDQAGNYRWVVGKDANNANLDFLLGMNPDGTLRFITQGLANDLADASGPSAFDGSAWFHLVGVQDSTAQEIRLYVNGAKVGSKPITARGVTAPNKLRIGARGSDAGQKVLGRIDEVAIYKSVLSDARIAAHFQAGSTAGGNYEQAVTTDAPFAWWRLGDAPAAVISNATDSGTAHKNGVYRGSVTKSEGIPGSGDGSADFAGGHVEIDANGSLDSGGSDLTIEAWFQPDGPGGWILGKDDNNDALDYLFGVNANGSLRFISQGLSNDLSTSPGLPADGLTWYHIVAVQDRTSGTATLYVNGVVAGSKPLTAVTSVLASGPLRIGARGADASQAVNGRIDELAIYEKVLTPERIQAHYRSGIYSTNLALAIVTQPRSRVAAGGDSVTFEAVAKVTGGGGNLTPAYQWKKDGVDVPNATVSTLRLNSLSAADAGRYKAVITLPGGLSITSDEAVLAVVTSTGSFGSEITSDKPYGWWSLADAPAMVVPVVQDAGSGRKTGIYQGAVYNAPGIPGAGADLAGDFSGGHVDVADPDAFHSGGGALTVEAWVQPDSAGSFRWLVGKDDDNNHLDYLLGMNPNGTFRFITQGLTHDILDSSGPRVFDGVLWYHVVGVQDPSATEVRLYVNGELAGSVPLTKTGVTAVSALRIGARGSSAEQNVDGRIDEVAIYKTVLPPERIQAHFNAGQSGTGYAAAVAADSPFGWWRLGEAPVRVVKAVADATANQNKGEYPDGVFASPGIPGAANDNAADFRGGHVDIDNPAAFDSAGGGLTVEAWVQPDATGGWIVGKDDNNVNLDYLLGFNGTQFRFISQGLSQDISGGTIVFNGNNWYHVVGVIDPSAALASLYVDGVPVGTTPLADSGVTAASKLRIGARGADAAQAVNSRIDEVAIYKTALTAQRVQAHYAAGKNGSNYAAVVSADHPNGWWRFNDAPREQVFAAADKGTGANPGVYQGKVIAAPGIPGSPDGAGDFAGGFVDIQNPAAFDSGMTPLTLEAWVQPDTATGWILGKDNNNTALDYLLGFNQNTIRFIAQGLRHDIVSGPITVDGQQWHFAAVVQDPAANEIRLYVDGLLSKATPVTTNGILASNKLRFGARGADAGQAVNSRIDEVAVYKSVLSEARIQAHYIAGLKTPAAGELRLDISWIGTRVKISWERGVLESSSKIGGGWSPVSSAISPYSIETTGNQTFFRLRSP